MKLVITVVVDVAPVEYGQDRRQPTIAAAEAHAEREIPRLLEATAAKVTGATARVTEVVVDP